MALIALGHSKCAFCGEALKAGDALVATGDGPPFSVPGLPYLHDNAAHQTCFDRWPLRAVYLRPELLNPGLLDQNWPQGARWAVIEWDPAHLRDGLPSASRWLHPARFIVPPPPTEDMWSLLCEFEPPPSSQGTPSLARVRFAVDNAPHDLLVGGTQLGLFDPTFGEAMVYVL